MMSTNKIKKKVLKKMDLQRVFYGLAIIMGITATASFCQVTYSSGWTATSDAGAWGNNYHMSSTANATATIKDTGTEAFVIYRSGPQSGIFQAVVDGNSATMVEIDGYASAVLWNKKSVIASNLSNGPHTIVVTVTGRKNASASGSYVQLIDKWTLGRGMWSPEKAWAWYKSKPWIVGWNYTPTTCVNATEWWQDEKKANDSIINRDLRLGELLGYNSIIVYMQYLVWEKDSAYYKDRFNKFLAIADSHHFTVSPVFFDDVNFICSGDNCGNSHLGDQGAPNPNKLMSQWNASPGPVYILDANYRPKFKRYVQDFVKTFGQDKRILMWDLYNEPGNSGIGGRSFSLIELVFQWVREIGTSQPLTISEWSSTSNGWPYNMSDICSFHGYTNNGGLSGDVNSFRSTQRPIICTEWLARPQGTDIQADLPLFKRLGVGAIQWSVINGQMHCEYSWGGSNNPWFHDVVYNDGTPYRQDEVDAILANFAHKTINWVAGATDGAIVAKSGCTNPLYAQYDSMATVDNNTCTTKKAVVVRGCMDKNSKYYNRYATISVADSCNPVAVMQPPQAGMVKPFSQESFRFLGKNRIQIFGKGTMQVQLFSINGRLVWSGKVEGPGIVDMSKSVKNGIYYTRISGKDGNTLVSPMFGVNVQH